VGRRTRIAQLHLEALERREVPAAISFNPTYGTVTIRGSAEADAAVVTESGGVLTFDVSGGINESESFNLSAVKKILFKGGEGDDRFFNNSSVTALAYGNAGDDYLEGGSGIDKLFGGPDADILIGYYGNDLLNGGGQIDQLFGLPGNDTLTGGGDNDGLHGGEGTDSLTGGPGINTVDGVSDGNVKTAAAAFSGSKIADYTPTDASPTPGLSELVQSIVDLTNQERRSRGLSALSVNLQLTQAAEHHAGNMARLDTMAHTLPGADLPTLQSRLDFYGYDYAKAGENVAYNFATASAVVNAWMNSSGHRQNILDPSYSEIGVGVGVNSRGQLYFCQVFGQPF